MRTAYAGMTPAGIQRMLEPPLLFVTIAVIVIIGLILIGAVGRRRR
jgi:hypothetical protein